MTNTKDLHIERFMPARPGKVWMAWTEPDMVERWWNPFPEGKAKVDELEVTQGGRAKIQAPDPQGGATLTFHLNYKKVVPSKEITFTVRAEEKGDEGPEMRVQFLPEEDGEETKMIFDSPKIPEGAFEDASAGWQAFFDKLEDALTSGSVDLMFEGGEGISVREAGESED